MNCVNCNKEMEKGYICSSSRIFWSKKPHKIKVPTLVDDNNIKILPASWSKIQNIEAYICKNCSIVIIKY